MKLGILTAPFPDTDLFTVADWAASVGFEALEIACWPRESGEARRYGGTAHLDTAGMTQGRADGIVAALTAKGITISALGYYPNPLHPDQSHRDQVLTHLKQVITAASLRLFPQPGVVGTALLAVESPEAALKLLSLAQERLSGMVSAFELIGDWK